MSAPTTPRPRIRLVVVSGLLAVIAGLVVAVVVAAVSAPHDGSDQDSCRAITDLTRTRDDAARPVSVGPGPLTVVLGDSYAAGAGLADPRNQSWPAGLGRSLQRTVWVDAVGSTGMVNDGTCGGQAYASRVAAVLARHPDLVVVQGGLNDSGFPPEQVRANATALLTQLRAVPHVVLVGPSSPPEVAADHVARTDTVLRDSATAAGRPYVSTLGWPLTYGSDGLHPTLDGHVTYARLLADTVVRTGS